MGKFSVFFHKHIPFFFIYMLPSFFNWDILSKHRYLPPKLIRDHFHLVNWNYISIYQPLSEELIMDFREYINWQYISAHQKLSKEFIDVYSHKLDMFLINEYQIYTKGRVLATNFCRREEKIQLVKYQMVINKLSPTRITFNDVGGLHTEREALRIVFNDESLNREDITFLVRAIRDCFMEARKKTEVKKEDRVISINFVAKSA